MSKREPGCLGFLFGSCARKKHRNRNAVSVEHANKQNKEIATQTAEQAFRSSAPASLFPATHKPTIAVKDSNGFHVQNASKDRLIIKNDIIYNNYIENPQFRYEIESIHSDHNQDALLSSRSIQQFFSPNSPNSTKVLPDPFRFESKTGKPRLMPITPEQFARRKFLPAHKPVKVLDKIEPDINLEFSNKEE